jgi:hypothetical protein
MLSFMTGPIAGPSRLRCFTRSLHYSAALQATPKRRPVLSTPPSKSQQILPPRRSPVRQPIKPLETPLEHSTGLTPPLKSTWAWRPVPNPTQADVLEEERTVFARPFELGRPRMYWFGIVISGLFFTTWIIFPPPARSLPPVEGQT